METYQGFGRALANHISFSRSGAILFIEGASNSLFPPPDKLSLPSRLKYTSETIQFR